MRTHSALILLCLLGVLSTAQSAERSADDIFTRESIVEVMRDVRDYQLSHPWKETDRNWIRATYYTGVMGLYRTTRDPQILAQARRWAQRHEWAEGNERERANKKTCGQTYLELYFIEPESANIATIRAYVDSRIEEIASGQSPRESWYYCDTLYVGPPTIAMLGKATGQQKYYDYLNEVYWDVTDHLFDKEYGLFYRDKRYFDAKTENGRKVFWSRGNGWVIGGIPRILQHLPKDNERYDDYIRLLEKMAAAIGRRQGDDGLWRSNLDDPGQYPNPETSGTAFFCYAMAWGINNGMLDRDEFLPVVIRAWEGLVRHVHPDGKLGFVQPVGAEPKPATEEMTHEYAMGLFLLAGEEMVKLVESGVINKAVRKKHEKERREQTEKSGAPSSDGAEMVEMPLWDRFKRIKAPGTGRLAIQLTSGDAFCYPLYYFIPSFTKDRKHLIYHRAGDGQVQLHRLNLRTGESAQLTHGNTPHTRWKNWCVESGRGVLDHRSVLNVARNQVVYFTGPLGNEVRVVDVETLDDRLLFMLPDNREAVGQNCTTPDGHWLVYIDSPRGSMYRQPVKGAKVMGYHFDSEEHRMLAEIDCHTHHVLAYDNEHFIFCHPPNGMGMMMTDLDSGKWEYLRAGDPGVPVPAGDDSAEGHVCHFVATKRGICYEVIGRKDRHERQRSGLYDPLRRRRFEFPLPDHFGYTHTGWDPEGRLWFWEDAARGHRLVFLKRLAESGGEFVDLTGPWKTYGSGQKSHFHPQLTPDRRWILFTGGDADSETNHIFLLDAADLRETDVISPEKLSPTGENDLTRSWFPGDAITSALPVKSLACSGFEPAVQLGSTTAGASTTVRADSAEEAAPRVRRFATNGGWCWFQDPRAIIHDGRLIVGSVSGSGSEAGDVRVSVYDLESERNPGTFVLHSKLQSDDHNTPAFYVRPDRRILAVYAYHTSPAHYYRISEPGDPTQWGPEQTFSHPHGISYMNLYYHPPDNTLYNFYRDTRGTYCPAYLASKDHGTTWRPGGQLIFHDLEGRHRPYPRYWSDGEYIHVSFTEAHPQEYRNGCGVYYAKFKAGKFYRADGTLIKGIRTDGPLLPGEADTVFKGDPQNKAWTSSIVTDPQRRIYVAYSVNRSASDHRFRYSVWDGTRWHDHEVAYAGPGLYPKAYDYTGLITIDPSNPGRVYFSTNVDPTHGTCNTSGKHEMYAAATADLGKTWKFTPLTRNSTGTNVRPVCVAGEEHVAVLWMRGRYSTYMDYDTDIVGFIRRR